MQPVLEAMMTLRGIDFVAAATLVAELGDLKRFAHPRELMSFLGLVPSEYTSGDARHLGKITKTGNGHVRWILIEAGWIYLGHRSPRVDPRHINKSADNRGWQPQGVPRDRRSSAFIGGRFLEHSQKRTSITRQPQHTGTGTRCAGHDVGESS